MSLDLTDDKSVLVQVMHWGRHETNLYEPISTDIWVAMWLHKATRRRFTQFIDTSTQICANVSIDMCLDHVDDMSQNDTSLSSSAEYMSFTDFSYVMYMFAMNMSVQTAVELRTAMYRTRGVRECVDELIFVCAHTPNVSVVHSHFDYWHFIGGSTGPIQTTVGPRFPRDLIVCIPRMGPIWGSATGEYNI